MTCWLCGSTSAALAPYMGANGAIVHLCKESFSCKASHAQRGHTAHALRSSRKPLPEPPLDADRRTLSAGGD